MARKKKKRREFSTVFAFMSDPPPDEVFDAEDNAPGLRGETSLWDIRPDPGQPRNLLPISLDEPFKTNQLSPQETIKAWQTLGSSSFENLRKLADSIAQHGLINPITVRPAPEESEVKYLIVTGERRWWSHVLLASEDRHINRGNSSRSADQIKINLTPEGTSIRAHQLIENLIREDLNAVEKAKGMWALRLELSNVPPDSDLNVSFGSPPENLVPWTEVEKALDISSRYRSYITSALQLTEEAQRLVQEHDLSESLIRPIVQKLSKEPELQMKALEQLLAWQQSEEAPRSLTRAVKQLVDELLNPPAPVMTRHASVATTEEVPAASSQSEHSAPPPLRETPSAYSEDTRAPWAGKEVSEPFNGAATVAPDVHQRQDLATSNYSDTTPASPDVNEPQDLTSRTDSEGREDLTFPIGSQAEQEKETLVREPSVTPSPSEPIAGPLSEPDSDEISHEINLTANSLLNLLKVLDRVPPESWSVLTKLRARIDAYAN